MEFITEFLRDVGTEKVVITLLAFAFLVFCFVRKSNSGGGSNSNSNSGGGSTPPPSSPPPAPPVQ